MLILAQGGQMNLKRVDRLEILVVVDNYADTLLPSAAGVIRPAVGKNGSLPSDTLLAEHGLCLLLTAERGERRSQLILDAGYSPVAAPRNLRTMGIDRQLDSVAGLVISHGHEDHVGSAMELVSMTGNPPLWIHPEAFRHPRFFRADDGTTYRIPELLERSELQEAGIDVCDVEAPSVVDDVFLLTSEIPRVTSFERGLPGSVHEVDGELVPDAVIDDQAVVVDVAEHGLVVVSGCAHAGIVNTVLYARRLTSGRPIHAVIGGFHLSGPSFREAITPTLDAIEQEHPDRVVPMHCTGVEAKRHFRERFGVSCAESAVGTTFVFPF